MAIEEEFSIEIPDKEADQIHSGKDPSAPYHFSLSTALGANATDTASLCLS